MSTCDDYGARVFGWMVDQLTSPRTELPWGKRTPFQRDVFKPHQRVIPWYGMMTR